jgi:hypothetical protein
MNQAVNVNENENVSITTNYNSNDNVIKDKYARARKVEGIADSLLEKFNLDIGSRPFMCKVALRLSEARIWDNYEQSLKATKSKVGLFIYLCKRDGV